MDGGDFFRLVCQVLRLHPKSRNIRRNYYDKKYNRKAREGKGYMAVGDFERFIVREAHGAVPYRLPISE